MHYHLEIIMPPTENISKAVEQILQPFQEGGKDEDGFENKYTFWDWYVIGGRWAGAKLKASLNKEKLAEFYAELTARNVTVSSIQAGKQELRPKEQIPMVDKLWKEFFPEFPGDVCPLFSHYHNQYDKEGSYGDVLTLKDVPEVLTASRVIFAKPSYSDPNVYTAEFMIEDSIYNGVSFIDTKWDGTFKKAVKMHRQKLKNYTKEAQEIYTPKPDWLVVTVDYHN